MAVLRVLSVNTIFTEVNATAVRKKRENAALVLKWEGETVYADCRGERVLSNAAHPVLLPKGSDYEWRCTKAGWYTIVEFDTDFVCEQITGFACADAERMRQRFQALELESIRKKPYWQFKACGALYEMLYELFTTGSGEYTPSDKLEKIKPAVDYMIAHYNEALSNDLLAGLTGVSTVYFRKIFTAAYGMPPMHYLHRVRIQRAKEMLRSDYGTLSNVAASVGYPNVFHFSKAFKQIAGISPGAYARGV
ncbi:MAG: helix-turn-helix transcriptional regulator [Clostridia bacterium]|nr:helix-turn-helix transcriptional regulator [Clostridia bacterium]